LIIDSLVIGDWRLLIAWLKQQQIINQGSPINNKSTINHHKIKD